jgi:mannitol 2-dehydrogenase
VPGAERAAFRAAVPGRFANAAVADTLERLATDASDRIPKFVLPTIRDRLAAGEPADRAATIVAAWARTAAGADDGGHPLALHDRRAAALTARARSEATTPGAFLADPEVFGDLATDARFAAAYGAARASLDAAGARATLAALR